MAKAPVKPFGIGGRWKRFIAAFDIHGDKMHLPTVETFFKFSEEIWKPQIRICGGDVFDFRPLRNGASKEEREESMLQDYRAGMDWLRRFKPNYFCRGNHDERLWDLAISGKGVEGDFARIYVDTVEGEVKRMKCLMLPYEADDGVLQLGHMKVAHGFFNGMNCAKQMADAYGNIIFGHNHVIQVSPVSGLDRRAARCCGCMCDLKQDYNKRRTTFLRQAHGFVYGVLNESNGNFHIFQAEQIGGVWVMPSDVVMM